MVVELLTPVAGWALGKAADTAWTLATDQVQTKLQRTDIERAIRAGLEAVQAWEKSLEVPALLFKSCDDKQKRQFLEQLFADAGVVEQLQRPLAGKGEPDLKILQGHFEQVATDSGIGLTTDSLPQWLRIFSKEYVSKTALFIKYEVARQRYLQQLANWYDDVKFLGISVAGQEETKSEKLLKIFVMPDVKERSGSSKALETFKEELLQYLTNFQKNRRVISESELLGNPTRLSDADLDRALKHYLPSRTSKQEILFEEQRRTSAVLKQSGRIYSANRVLLEANSSRCVLLGAPGSGKTTLMSYFAVALATGGSIDGLGVDEHYLPILVRIRDWIQSDKNGLLDYIRAFATEKLSVKDLPDGFFEHWLEAGKALILLDGLDEVANEARRDEVVNQIEVFLQAQLYRDNPAIITSRPAGYKQAYFRTEEFPHYDLLPFDQPKIDEFIKNWYDTRLPDAEKSQRQQQTLKKALSERDRIQVLAKNPLLLTIIALIHRYEAYLPRDRHQLYNRAVETLLTNWDAGKDIDYQWPLQHLKRDAVRRMMEQLAYWIHSEGSVGDDEGGTLIDQDELIEQLSGFIAEETGCKRYEANKDAERFLEFIRFRTGLLNEQGQDCYAFVHKTFQEYLTAEDIRYRQVEDGFEVVQEHIDDYLHDPHWEEVLLLLIAQQPKKRVAQLMQQILEHDTLYEQWLHRNLFFAANCLAENVKLTDELLIEKILNQLVKFITEKSPLISLQLQQLANKCLMNLGETDFQDTALQLLEAQQEKLGAIQFQLFRSALGQEALAKDTLRDLLRGSDSAVRFDAALVLWQSEENNPTVVDALLERLSDNSSSVRFLAVMKIEQLGKVNPTVVNALIERLDDDAWSVRSHAAEALRQLGGDTPEVLQMLIEHLNQDDSTVRLRAMDPIEQLGRGKPAIIPPLINCLNDADDSIRFRGVRVLGELGDASPTVIQALADRLDDANNIVSSYAAEALGKLNTVNSRIIQTLFAYLMEEEERIGDSYSIAHTLGNLSSVSIEAKQALITCLKDSGVGTRNSIAEAIGDLENPNSELIQALRDCLEDDDISVRYFAADALRDLGQADDVVARILVNCLNNKEDDIIREFAVSSLGKLDKQADIVIPELVEWIEQNQQFDYVSDGIDSLRSLMTKQG